MALKKEEYNKEKSYFLENIELLIKNSSHLKNKSQLASLIGITNMTFSNIAKRSSLPSLDVAKRCADFFNLALDDILYKDLSKNYNNNSTIAVYTLNNLETPDCTISVPLNIESFDFGILIKEEDSQIFQNDIFIIKKNANIENYDYVIIKVKNEYFIKQIIYKNLNVLFANLDDISQYELIEEYQIIGKVITKVIN
jgi:DNA-binding XRE family transcriptional regulator